MKIIDRTISYELAFDKYELEPLGIRVDSIHGTEISADGVLYEKGDQILLGCCDVNGAPAKLMVNIDSIFHNILGESLFLLHCNVPSSGEFLPVEGIFNGKILFSIDNLNVFFEEDKFYWCYSWISNTGKSESKDGVTGFLSAKSAIENAISYFEETPKFIVPKELFQEWSATVKAFSSFVAQKLQKPLQTLEAKAFNVSIEYLENWFSGLSSPDQARVSGWVIANQLISEYEQSTPMPHALTELLNSIAQESRYE